MSMSDDVKARECVTHHNACDCREAHFAKLEAEIERLRIYEHAHKENYEAASSATQNAIEQDAYIARLEARLREVRVINEEWWYEHGPGRGVCNCCTSGGCTTKSNPDGHDHDCPISRIHYLLTDAEMAKLRE